jgi:hypothetical protein
LSQALPLYTSTAFQIMRVVEAPHEGISGTTTRHFKIKRSLWLHHPLEPGKVLERLR